MALSKHESKVVLVKDKFSKVYIPELHPSLTAAVLKEYLGQFGAIDEVRIKKRKKIDPAEPNPLHFAFVKYKSQNAAQRVIDISQHSIGHITFYCEQTLLKEEFFKKILESSMYTDSVCGTLKSSRKNGILKVGSDEQSQALEIASNFGMKQGAFLKKKMARDLNVSRNQAHEKQTNSISPLIERKIEIKERTPEKESQQIAQPTINVLDGSSKRELQSTERDRSIEGFGRYRKRATHTKSCVNKMRVSLFRLKKHFSLIEGCVETGNILMGTNAGSACPSKRYNYMNVKQSVKKYNSRLLNRQRTNSGMSISFRSISSTP